MRDVLTTLGFCLMMSPWAGLHAAIIAGAPSDYMAPSDYIESDRCHPSSVSHPVDVMPKDSKNRTNHLLRYTESLFGAFGDPVTIAGRVLDTHCVPIPNASILLWQADRAGHMMDILSANLGGQPGPGPGPGNFTYSGMAETDNTGHFYFFTIMPGTRHGLAPHVNLQVQAATFALYRTIAVFQEGPLASGSLENGATHTAHPHHPNHRRHHSGPLLLQPQIFYDITGVGKGWTKTYFVDIVLPKGVPFKGH